MSIGERIDKLLVNKHITIYKLSKDTYLSQTTINNWIQGKKKPNKANINLIAYCTKVSFDWLWFGKEEDTSIVEYGNNEIIRIITDSPKNYTCPECIEKQKQISCLKNDIEEKEYIVGVQKKYINELEEKLGKKRNPESHYPTGTKRNRAG